MSLFYFNFRQGTSYSPDEEGCELSSVEEAYLGAVRAAQDMWRELLIERQDPRNCAFEVTDRDGNDLFTLPFNEVLEACNRKAEPHPQPRPGGPMVAAALLNHRRAVAVAFEVRAALRLARENLRETRHLLRSLERERERENGSRLT